MTVPFPLGNPPNSAPVDATSVNRRPVLPPTPTIGPPGWDSGIQVPWLTQHLGPLGASIDRYLTNTADDLTRPIPAGEETKVPDWALSLAMGQPAMAEEGAA